MDYYRDSVRKKDENRKSVIRRRELMLKAVAAFNGNGRIKTRFVESKRNVSEFDKPFIYHEGFKAEKILMGSFCMELLHKCRETSEADIRNGCVILQLHGGGYVTAFKNQYRRMAQWYCDSLNGADVLTVDYRVAPEHLFPAALDDAFLAYKWLLDNGYSKENIVVCGDSAGGGLALSLCLYLKDHGYSMPAGLVCMSPWTDLTMSGESYKKNRDKDIVLGICENSIIFDNPYPGTENPANPYISPAFGDFSLFPPMLIQVGADEMLLDDSLALVKKAREAGAKVRLTVYEEMFHVFQLCGPVLDESKEAWAEIRDFFEHIFQIMP